MTLRAIFIFAALALTLFSAAVHAAPSCTAWMWQQDGTYWQQCVNDDGSRHCYRASDANGSGAVEISCS